jgi:hypothetical protein
VTRNRGPARSATTGWEMLGSVFIRLKPWKATQWFYIQRCSPGRYTITCFCDGKRDGGGHCRHTRYLWPLLKPWWQARLRPVSP